MARFFKPAKSNQLEFMKELPVNLMMKGIETADAANDQIYNQTDLLGNAVAKVQHLTSDDERVKAIQQAYNNRIQETTQALMANPADYRKQMPLVRSLTRDLSTDMQTGELAAIQSNAAKMQAWDATYKPLVAKGDITPEAYTAMKSSFIKQHKGTKYDPMTGTYNQINTEDVYKTQDFNKIIKAGVDGIKANSEGFKQESDGGKWLVTTGGKKEWVTAARIAQLATDSLMSDQNVLGYLKQGGKYGYLRGVTDDKGQFIQPYTLDAKGNPVFNERSILTPAIRGAVGREAFMKKESESSLQTNPYTMESVTFGHALDKMKAEDVIHDENFKGEAALKWEYDQKGIRLKSELAANAAALKAGAKAGAVKGTAAKPKTGAKIDTKSAEPQLVASPDGVTTYSPFGGSNAISLESLQTQQRSAKEDLAHLLALSKDTSISANQRDVYMQRADEAKALVDRSYSLLADAKTYADKQLTAKGYSPSEIKAVHDKYGSTTGAIKQKIAQIDEAITSSNVAHTPSGNSSAAMQLLAQRESLSKSLQRYETIHSDLVGTVKNYFKENSALTQQKVEGVGLQPTDKETIYKQLKANPKSFLVRSSSNEDKEMAFDDIIGNNPKESIEIERINPPTAGLGVTVSFKVKDRSGKASGESLLMTIPTSLNNTMAESLAKSDKANAKQLAGTLKSELKQNFLSSIKNKIRDVVAPGETQPAGYFSFHDDGTDFTSQIKVVPVTDKGNPTASPVAYKAYAMLPNGNYAPLTIGANRSAGNGNEFPSEEALADAFVNFVTKNKK